MPMPDPVPVDLPSPAAVLLAQAYTVYLTDGRAVCFSFGRPVAAWIPGRGYVRTARRFSSATSRHQTWFTHQAGEELPDDEFRALIAPIDARRE